MNNIYLAIIIGGLTGIISHMLKNKKTLIFPQKRKKGVHLGFIADFLIGSAAAVFTITYLLPDSNDWRTVVGIAILSGMSAENILLYRELNTERSKVEGLDNIQKKLTN
jgi:hypothetical protein